MKYLLCMIAFFALYNKASFSQFDKSGYRYLYNDDKDNTNTKRKFVGTDLYVLNNTGLKNGGIEVKILSINSDSEQNIKYYFDDAFSQKIISQIGIENFSFNKQRLALLTNNGVYYADSATKKLKLISNHLDGFSFDDLVFSDSILFIYLNTVKTNENIFFNLVSLNIYTKEIRKIYYQKNTDAEIYNNFKTPVTTLHNGEIFRIDFVSPEFHRYKKGGDVSKIILPTTENAVKDKRIPTEILSYLDTYDRNNPSIYLDTTLKLRYSYYHNALISSLNERSIALMYFLPNEADKSKGYKISIVQIQDTSVFEKHLILNNFDIKDTNHRIRNATEIMLMGNILHIAEDENTFYFVVQNASNLSPYDMNIKEYRMKNYQLQMSGKVGIGVIMLRK